MSKKSLIETNPYLQNSEKYRDSLITNVSSSTAIETGDTVWSVVNTVTEVVNSILIVPPPKQKSTSQ
jgi:sulfur relay (sulfurtransferase) DsrC/TusE family protein